MSSTKRKNHATLSGLDALTLRTDSVIFASFFSTCRMSTISYGEELADKPKGMIGTGREDRGRTR